MIRITIVKANYTGWDGVKVPAKTIVKEFPESQRSEAADWFIYDSYFDEPYTEKAMWEVISDKNKIGANNGTEEEAF